MKEKELLSGNDKLHYPGKDKDGWNMVHADTSSYCGFSDSEFLY